jgi:oligopeptidase B
VPADAAVPADATGPERPVAPRRLHRRDIHGTTTEDPWFWLRDRDDPAALDYLRAENAYTKAVTASWDPLREALFEEIRSRIQEDDESVPVRRGAWWYSARTVEGQQYALHVRRADVDGAPGPDEVVYLDENALAQGHDYFRLGDLEISPSGHLVAYTVDTTGNERYSLRIRDLQTGDDLDDRIDDVTYGVAWSAADEYVFYLVPDEAWRPWRVMRHRLGNAPGHSEELGEEPASADEPENADAIVYTEPDERFWLGIANTRSEELVLIGAEAKNTSEWRFVRSDKPLGEPTLVEPRREGVEYRIEHSGARLLVLTNDGAPNFRVMSAPLTDCGRSCWTEVLPEPAEGRIEDVDAFAGHVVVTERRSGVPEITVYTDGADGALGTGRRLDFDEEVFEAGTGANPEYHTSALRFGFSSLVTPDSVYDEDMGTGKRTLRKRQPVLGGYNPDAYASHRLWAPASDGTDVPVSIVYRRDLVSPGQPAPLLLYGYGSYEIVVPDRFSSLRLSLLDRGVVFAIAHVRGGGEMGRRWYEQGRLLHKQNTFGDFIAAAEHLVAEGWTAPDRLAIRGGSAGGLLVGAVLNQRPDLFRAAVAEVPFVDNVNTMLDASIPLTVTEYDEWGDPTDPEFFAAMRDYSPYENVAAQDYPALLVTAGLNDPRVQYWEPAKWVAKLRATASGGGPVLLKTEMGAGHSGPSGRYDVWKDEAFVYAFLLDVWGLADRPAAPV